MKVLKPTGVTDAVLVSSTLAESDAPAWSGATTYTTGQVVIAGHRVWESLQSSNLNHNPVTDTSDPPYWLDVGPTNRWAMFDQVVNTRSSGAAPIVVELQPGIINAIGLIELQGTSARVQMHDGATQVYDQTRSLDGTPILDWYDYFFEPYDVASEVLFEGLPQYLTGIVTVTIAGTGTVACGGLIAGNAYSLGGVEYGATAGITDYSRKETNAFGVTTLVRRSYSRRSSQRLRLPKAQVRRVAALLADLRATPCLWIGVEDDTDSYAPLVVFGWYRDWQIEVAYARESLCSLEIEGMT